MGNRTQNGFRLAFCKGDWLAILLVGLLAIACAAAFVPREALDGQRMVQVFQDGQLLREVSLDTDIVLEAKGNYKNTITVDGGRVAITQSDCPGTDCVHSGWISSAGRSIVCLPNRVEVRISGTSDVDFTVR